MDHASGVVDKYYSFNTQSLANYYPSWTKLRIERSSVGQQLLAPIGREFDIVQRSYATASGVMALSTCDINVVSEIQRVRLPRKIELSEDVVHTATGDANPISIVEDLDQMTYLVPPTRITAIGVQAAGLPSGVSFNAVDENIPYDLPHVDMWKEEKTSYIRLYQEADEVKMEKFFVIGDMELPYAQPQNFEPISKVSLLDSAGSLVSGLIQGYCLNGDYLVTLIGETFRVYDVRIPIKENTEADWSGNTEYVRVLPLFDEVVYADPLISGLATDIDHRYFYTQSLVDVVKFKLDFDYGIFDYDKKYFYTNEGYTTTIIDGVAYSGEPLAVWNYFDEYGLRFDTPRLIGESNQDYKDRLLTVFKFRSNSTIQGLINGVSRETSLDYYGWLPQSGYPTNLFDDGEFYDGYPIYVSGEYPSTVSGIAKINPLFDPTFYSSVVDPSSNIASERFVDYTREILETFPILWGSGETDPSAFIWDLAPFDGGANNTNVVPDFYSSVTSGVDRIYYQSGVSDPNSQDLLVRIVPVSGDIWSPDIHTGNFYIHDDRDYLFSTEIVETIPSGEVSYQLLNPTFSSPYFLYDQDGVVAPSGVEWLHVADLDTSPQFEFTVDTSGLVTINHDHSGLTIRYEGTPASEWHRLPWDFNPLHGMGYDGFIWISDKKQVLNDDSFSLEAIPNTLPIGGSQSLLLGTLLDEDGLPVIGAEIYFRLAAGNEGTVSPNGTPVLTQFDGTAIATYSSPIDLDVISASGYISGPSDFYANPSGIGINWAFDFHATDWDSYSIPRPAPIVDFYWGDEVGYYVTKAGTTPKLWAVEQIVNAADRTSLYIRRASTLDGTNWISELPVYIDSASSATPFNINDGHPLVMMKRYGSNQQTASFKGYTYARTWAGLWRTLDGSRWSRTWAGINEDNSVGYGPQGYFDAGLAYNSMVVLHPGEPNETLFDLGGCNQSAVWRTTDGTNWTASVCPWGPRVQGGITAFQNKIWVIAGNQSAIPFAPYTADPMASVSAPLHDMWYSDDGISWTSWGTLPFDMSVGFATVVYRDRLWVIGGVNKIDSSGLIGSSEVWSFDGTDWAQHANAPWGPTAYQEAIVFNNAIRPIGGGWVVSTGPAWESHSLTGWAMTLSGAMSAFFPNKTLGTSFDDMLLYSVNPDISGYGDYEVKILFMSPSDSYNVALPLASGWVYSSDDGYFRTAIGGQGYFSDLGDGISDSAHNIDITSLKVDGTSVWPIAAHSGHANFLAYEVDEYDSPTDFGKLVVVASNLTMLNYAAGLRTTFDTYAPTHPVGSLPTPSGTYLYFNADLDHHTQDNLRVITPGDVEVIASGWYEDVPIPEKRATINIGLDPLQQGALRLDEKFIDYFSYLRWTGL
jgi:hypothetical protein